MKQKQFTLSNIMLTALFWGIVICCSFCGCEHRALTDYVNKHYLRVYIEDSIMNLHYGFYDEGNEKPQIDNPQMFRVVLCDPVSGRVIQENYINGRGSDMSGNYIDGYIYAEPGEYNLLMYNFDTQSVHIKNNTNYSEMLAYTNSISDGLKNGLISVRSSLNSAPKIVYEPDHLYVSLCEPITIDKEPQIDTLKVEDGGYFRASTVVETYYLQVNIRGARYVKSAVAVLNGMVGSKYLSIGTANVADSVSLYINLKSDHTKIRSEISHAYSTFNTFGRLPSYENDWYVVFEFSTTYGTTQVDTINIGHLINDKELINNRWIIIDEIIDIQSPGTGEDSGGLTPEVGDWNTIDSEIKI